MSALSVANAFENLAIDTLLTNQCSPDGNVWNQLFPNGQIEGQGEVAREIVKSPAQEQADACRELRAHEAAFCEVAEQFAQLSCDKAVGRCHPSDLDGICNDERIAKCLRQDTREVLGKFAARWAADIKKLVGALQQACPQWSSFRETLLDNTSMVEEMCSNPRYGQIGPLQQQLNRLVRFIKHVHADRRGALVDAELMKTAKDTADFGVETVAFTFFLYKVTRSWKDIVNVAVASKAVETLRKELAPSGIVLTAQMESHLQAWARGDFLKQAEGDAVLDKASSSAPDTVQEQGSATSAQAHSANSADPPAAAVPAEGAAPPAQKKRSLADRAKAAATRRRTA